MTTLVGKKKLSLYPVWTIIALFLMFGFGNVVEPWSTLTPMGVRVLGVFIGALLMTIATDQTFWPAILGIFALVFNGYMTGTQALTTWFGGNTIQQFIWICVLCGALKDSGAPVVISKKLLNMRICKGRPWVFVFVFFLASAIVGMMLAAGSPTILLMYSMLDGVFQAANLDDNNPKEKEFKKEMLLGTYLASMGAFLVPYMGYALNNQAIVNPILESYGFSFDNAAYFISTSACWLVFTISYVLIMRFVWKSDVSKLVNFDISSMGMTKEDLKLNKRQCILLGSLLIGVIYLMSLNFLPQSWSGYEIYSRMGTVWVWIVIIAILCMIKVNGQPFINGVKMLQNHTLWGIIALLGCFSICGSAIASDELGIKAWIVELLGPMLSGANWIWLVVIVVVLATVTTNFSNGMAVAFTLHTVTLPFACEMMIGSRALNPTVLAAAIIYCSEIAYLTYGAMVYAALLLTRKEVDKKFLWIKGGTTLGVYMVVAIVVFAACGYLIP